jgi:hypothetical protein
VWVVDELRHGPYQRRVSRVGAGSEHVLDMPQVEPDVTCSCMLGVTREPRSRRSTPS